MISMRKPVQGAMVCALGFLLVGCGGDDDSSTTPPPPSTDTAEGLWQGTTDTGRSITGLLLSDGTYYVLYSTTTDPTIVGGVVQGTGTSNNGSFTSTNARDFNIEGLGVQPATISASYFAKQSFNGTVTYTSLGNTVANFTTTYDAAYELTPLLSELGGTYSGQVASSAGVESATLTVNGNTGNVTGTSLSGCGFTGTATPRTDGNAFDMSVTFGGDPCLFANQTFTGIAYYDAVDKFLYAAAPNASRTDGVLFLGGKAPN